MVGSFVVGSRFHKSLHVVSGSGSPGTKYLSSGLYKLYLD